MSIDLEKLVKYCENYCVLAEEALEKLAKDTAKLDPKAKVRNRGKVIFPAEKSSDHKDHYPINNIEEGRAALRYAGKQKSAPWYNGSLEEMKKKVEKAVYHAFPTLKPEKTKKSALEILIEKYS